VIDLARLEAVVDRPELAAALVQLESRLPVGVRPRQCRLRTLVIGMLACLADGHQNAHLSALHRALTSLAGPDRQRLEVSGAWPHGPHELTYRQVEYTFGLVGAALAKDRPDGAAPPGLQSLCDALVEASLPAAFAEASASYAIDWTDVESFFRPPGQRDGPSADPEAGWGHRRGDGPGQGDEVFFGFYGSLMTMVSPPGGPAVPELIRRVQLGSCRHDPVPPFVAVVTQAVADGIRVDEVLADSGYSYKVPGHFALPLRRAGVDLVMDLHPGDRGPRGDYAGAIRHNGNLYCPATPPSLFELGPLGRGASAAETAAHDGLAAELSRHKLGRLTGDDADGYHRVACPAAMGKCRCPLQPVSMTLSRRRPEILAPPTDPPRCCTQQSITVGPDVNAKTRQRHDYPSPAHRLAYGRRSAAERSNSRLKDPAGINVSVRGWCKLAGIGPSMLFFACACVVVNFGLVDAFEQRVTRPAGPPAPRTRRRRRRTLADLAANSP